MKKRNDPDVSAVSSFLVAKCIGRSRTKVLDLVKRGIMPNPSQPQKYDLADCIQRYVNWVKRIKADTEVENDKQAVLKEKFKSLQLENRKRAGEVVEVEEVEEAFMRVISLIALRLEAIPGRLATELAHTSDPALVRQRLRHEISDTRTSAEAGLKDFVNRVKGRGSYQSPASESARRVGRSKTRPTRRIARARPVA